MSVATFAAALLNPAAPCPSGLVTWNGSDAAQRFGVYRNNVTVSLIEALADTFPVVQQLVGDAFFRVMAGEFARQSPPTSPVLAWYGDAFADFIVAFTPATGVPASRYPVLPLTGWNTAVLGGACRSSSLVSHFATIAAGICRRQCPKSESGAQGPSQRTKRQPGLGRAR